jgi:hypothetical protein
MSAVTTTKKSRSLAKLASIIRKHLRAGFQAGERHWRIAGKLFNEARRHFPTSGPNGNGQTFYQWVDTNFEHPWTRERLSRRTVRRWMLAARNNSGRGRPERSLYAIADKRSPQHVDYNPRLDWESGVRQVQHKLNVKALRREWDDERKEEREIAGLAKKIVDAGYRALAAVVHPDKPGGSKEAMAKLTAARKWLDGQIRSYA